MIESSSQFVVSVISSQYRRVLQVATATSISERRRHRCATLQAAQAAPTKLLAFSNLPRPSLRSTFVLPSSSQTSCLTPSQGLVIRIYVSMGATEYLLVTLVSSDRAVVI